MTFQSRSIAVFVSMTLALAAPLAQSKTVAEVLAAAKPADWRQPDPANTLYMELDAGRVVIELAPQFAPRLIANLKTLVHDRYFDGLAIMRAQDNYVVQWGDANEAHPRPLGAASTTVPAEFERTARELKFTPLPDRDVYASQTGFLDGFPAARDAATDRAWLVHCYGMVGAGRDEAADTGNGSELYAVIGHSPRHLDRNVTLVGRVVWGMELLSPQPRGHGELGFYTKDEKGAPIRAMHLASEVPEMERTRIELLRTDTQTFRDLIEARRNRQEKWFKHPAGHIEVCNVPLPARIAPAPR